MRRNNLLGSVPSDARMPRGQGIIARHGAWVLSRHLPFEDWVPLALLDKNPQVVQELPGEAA